MRRWSSRAARLVNVTHRMRSGGVPRSSARATRSVRTVVLPVPAGDLMGRRAGNAADVDDRGHHQDHDDSSDRPEHAADRHDGGSALAERSDHHEGSYHWQSWVLRAILVAVLVIVIVRGNR